MGTLEELIGMTKGADTTEDVSITFIVEDSTELNNSVVYLSPVTMDDLNIWYNVSILLEGKNNRKAVCTVLTDVNCGENKIRMNGVVRNKFGVSLGDSVSLRSFLEIPKGKKIVVRPIRDGCDFVQEKFFESYLRPYFFGANRPVNNCDIFCVKGPASCIKFKITKTLPSPFCIVSPATVINCEEPQVPSTRKTNEAAEVSTKVKGPQQSSATPPAQNGDALPGMANTDKLSVQIGETSFAHQNEIELKREVHVLDGFITERTQTLGRNHPNLLPLKRRLLKILYDLKQFLILAEIFLKDEQLLNTWNPHFLDIKVWVAMFLTCKNKFDEAESLLSGALEHVISMEFGFIERLKVKVLLATVLYSQNKWRDALKLLSNKILRGPPFPDKVSKFMYVLKKLTKREDLKLDRKYFAQTNQNVLIVKYHIGWFYCQLEEYILANQTLQETLPFMKETLGSDHLCSKLTEDLLKDCKMQMLLARERQL